MDNISWAKLKVSKMDRSGCCSILHGLKRKQTGHVAVLRKRIISALERNPVDVVSYIVNTDISSKSTEKPRPKRKCTKKKDEEGECSYIVHPDVHFKAVPFYRPIAELVQPSTLFDTETTNRFTFHLTPQQAHLIKNGISFPTAYNSTKEYSVQVQVRIGLLETTSAQNDNHPPDLRVLVNNTLLELPPQPKQNLLNANDNRSANRYQPLDITQYVRIDPYSKNVIEISYRTNYQRFVVGGYLVRKESSAQLLSNLKNKAMRVSYYTIGMIQQKLLADTENEIATTCLRVSLVCPLGKMRIKTPSRSTTCDHLQCFDVDTYLQMNEKKPSWLCPFCHKTASYDDLYIDEYFLKVLSSNDLPSDCTEIQLTGNGEWRSIGNNKTVQSKRPEAVELSLSDEEIEVLDVREAPTARRARSPDLEIIDICSKSPSPARDNSPIPSSVAPPLPLKKRINTQIMAQDQELSTSPAVIDLDSDSSVDQLEFAPLTSGSTTTPSPPRKSDEDDGSPPPPRTRRKQDLPSKRKQGAALRKRRRPLLRPPPLVYSSSSPASEKEENEETVQPTIPHRTSYSINKAKSSTTTLVLSLKKQSKNNETSQLANPNYEGDISNIINPNPIGDENTSNDLSVMIVDSTIRDEEVEPRQPNESVNIIEELSGQQPAVAPDSSHSPMLYELVSTLLNKDYCNTLADDFSHVPSEKAPENVIQSSVAADVETMSTVTPDNPFAESNMICSDAEELIGSSSLIEISNRTSDEHVNSAEVKISDVDSSVEAEKPLDCSYKVLNECSGANQPLEINKLDMMCDEDLNKLVDDDLQSQINKIIDEDLYIDEEIQESPHSPSMISQERVNWESQPNGHLPPRKASLSYTPCILRKPKARRLDVCLTDQETTKSSEIIAVDDSRGETVPNAESIKETNSIDPIPLEVNNDVPVADTKTAESEINKETGSVNSGGESIIRHIYSKTLNKMVKYRIVIKKDAEIREAVTSSPEKEGEEGGTEEVHQKAPEEAENLSLDFKPDTLHVENYDTQPPVPIVEHDTLQVGKETDCLSNVAGTSGTDSMLGHYFNKSLNKVVEYRFLKQKEKAILPKPREHKSEVHSDNTITLGTTKYVPTILKRKRSPLKLVIQSEDETAQNSE